MGAIKDCGFRCVLAMIIASLVLENMEPDILERLNNYIALMTKRQKEDNNSQLMIEAADEIKRLRQEIRLTEKAFLLTKTHHD